MDRGGRAGRARRAGAPRGRLRLGRVTPSAHLRYRIVHRTSDAERRRSETLRWTDAPDAYVRRALSRVLFEARERDQVVGGAATSARCSSAAASSSSGRHAARRSGRSSRRSEMP